MDAPIDPCRGRSSSSRTPWPPIAARASHVGDAVPDVVQALAAPGQEPAHRGVRAQRLQELNVTGPQAAADHSNPQAWPRAPPARRSPPGSPPRARTSPGTARSRRPGRGRQCRRDQCGSAAVARSNPHQPSLGIVIDMSEPRQPVIVGGARTPVGRLLGSLASKSASELGGVAIAGALDRAGIGPDRVQYVIMGQVLQAGAGQIPARQAAVAAGIAHGHPGADDQQGVPVRPGRHRARAQLIQAG